MHSTTILAGLSFSLLASALPAKRQSSIPTDGSLTFSCTYFSGQILPVDYYTVILPGDGSSTTSGFDATGNCGEGVLDNMNGQAIASTSWTCNYVGANTANITFTAPALLDGEVAAAIDAATGTSGQTCDEGNPETPDPSAGGEPPASAGDGTEDPSDDAGGDD